MIDYMGASALQASVQIKLDRVALGRLCRLGYLDAMDHDPASIRDAVNAALSDRLSPIPATPAADGRV
jgi:hypothetical protein